MPPAGFESTIVVFERAKTVHVLDRAATVVGLQISSRDLIPSQINSAHSFYFSMIRYNIILPWSIGFPSNLFPYSFRLDFYMLSRISPACYISQMNITICKVLSMQVCLVFRYFIRHMSKQILEYFILKCPQSTCQFYGLLMQNRR
jgi:hypothetical protein